MKKILVAGTAVWLSAVAGAQVTSIQASNPMSKGSGQNLDRVVCDVEETTGTRLGARKVCKTVLEWQQLRAEHRETVEKTQQMGTDTPLSR